MVSPEFKRRAPKVMVGVGAFLSASLIIGIPIYVRNSVAAFPRNTSDRPTTSASPFPSHNASSTPTPTETPSDEVETPTATPSKSPTPKPSKTKSPTPSPTISETPTTNSAPSRKPLQAKVTNSYYVPTGPDQGLAYIDSETKNMSHVYSTEFKTVCRAAGAVTIRVVSYTNGNLALRQKPTEYPELTNTICNEDGQVAQGFKDNLRNYADVLLPLANIS